MSNKDPKCHDEHDDQKNLCEPHEVKAQMRREYIIAFSIIVVWAVTVYGIIFNIG